MFLSLSSRHWRSVRGNPHSVAGVKNKKLFERKARVIFCLARQLLAGRTRRQSRKKRFWFLLSLWTKETQGIDAGNFAQ
jgi:hypothetical protein